MSHDEYRLTESQIAEQSRNFDWEFRPTEYLAPVVICDRRLHRYYNSIKEWVGRIQADHPVPLQKVEAIVGRWELDQNFSSIMLRWTSTEGVFQKEFGVGTLTFGANNQVQYVLVWEVPVMAY